jgi:hypothetical protein
MTLTIIAAAGGAKFSVFVLFEAAMDCEVGWKISQHAYAGERPDATTSD